MAETVDAKPDRRSDKAKADDGRVSLPQAARIAGLTRSTLNSWIVSGFITPTNVDHIAPGTGNHRRFDLRDLTAICAAADLRRLGVGVRAMRKIQTELRRYNRDLASARLALVRNDNDEVADVVLFETETERRKLIVSVYEHPGQTIIAEMKLAKVARQANRAYRNALKEKPAVRGWPKGRKKKPRAKRVAGREKRAVTA